MNYVLKNEQLSIRINSLGAELQSIVHNQTGREYIWQPGKETWDCHSLLLFPNAGRISRDRVLIEEKEYPMTMHGFAKDTEFLLEEKTENSLTLYMEDSENSRRSFPFAFRLEIRFALQKDRLLEAILLRNLDKKSFSFGLGLHPGFYCPIDLNESADDYVLEFNTEQTIHKVLLDSVTRLCTHEREPWLVQEKEFPIREGLFNDGPFTVEGCKAESIMLRSKKSGHFVKMGIKDFPVLTFWGNPGQMNLICIEPWCGMSDNLDSDHQWKTKPGNQYLEAGQIWERKVWFEVG